MSPFPSAFLNPGRGVAVALATSLVLASASGASAFFRPSPAGDGTTEHFFTVEITEGRIASLGAIEKALRAAADDSVSDGDVAAAAAAIGPRLRSWFGEPPLRGCTPTGRFCYVVICVGCTSRPSN